MSEEEYNAKQHAFVQTGCQGDFDQGWDAGVAFGKQQSKKLLGRCAIVVKDEMSSWATIPDYLRRLLADIEDALR